VSSFSERWLARSSWWPSGNSWRAVWGVDAAVMPDLGESELGTRLPGRCSCRSRLLPDYLPGEPHLQLSRQPCGERYDRDDWESGDLVPAALSVEHWWGTGESMRNMGSDRETSSLYQARRVALLRCVGKQAVLQEIPGPKKESPICEPC
jgi:hypothetical protein